MSFFSDQSFNFQVVDLKSPNIFVLQGLRHGPEIYWYEDGQRWNERNYRYGKENGLQKSWHRDGRPMTLKNFKEGIYDGDFFEWFSDGRISS